MSYNIDHWETIKMTDLRISMSALDKIDKKDIEYSGSALVNIRIGEGGIHGMVQGDILYVNKVHVTGMASGSQFPVLLSLLKSSIGILDAVLTWEGGDRITRLQSDDGKVTHDSIDIMDLIQENIELRKQLEFCEHAYEELI